MVAFQNMAFRISFPERSIFKVPIHGKLGIHQIANKIAVVKGLSRFNTKILFVNFIPLFS